MSRRASKKRNFRSFIVLELSVTIAAAIIAYFLGSFLYPLTPAFFQTVGTLFPQPFTATGYQVAFLTAAGVIWFVENTMLYTWNLRRV